jgi:hypothetical protein
MSDRIYSEEEVAKVIQRAVEMESKRSSSGKTGNLNGLTLRDLEQIAADAGIDPELMQKAAQELDTTKLPDNFEESTKVNRQEIVAEHWIKADVSDQLLNDLIIELNHRYGTSQEDISWWNKLFDDYSGVARVNRTRNSADWRYTDELEMYTTRVLMQQRGDKLRIRVSKRKGWNMSWKSSWSQIFLAVFSGILFSIMGGSLGFALLDNVIPGVIAGLALALLTIPISNAINKRRLEHHKQEVTDIAETLVMQAKNLSRENPSSTREKKRSAQKESDISDIEIKIDSDSEGSYRKQASQAGRIKNHLR